MSMLDLNRFRGGNGRVHFIGCAGAGMFPLLRIFRENGFRVSGSDLLLTPPLEKLRADGVQIFTGHAAENLPADDGTALLVIRTSAAAEENPEVAEALRRGVPVLRRGEALALIASLYRRVVTVSGSHGKTSISGRLAYLLRKCGMAPGWLVGGVVRSLEEHTGEAGVSSDFFVSEVDESDGTHTLIHSCLGVIPNVEDDHAWSVGGREQLMENFRTYASRCARIVYFATPETDALFAEHNDKVRLPLPANATWQELDTIIAAEAAVQLGFSRESAMEILKDFPGIDRRMTKHFENDDFALIEDYAHHPTELRECLKSFRIMYPGRRLTAVFQPHRYARLERYFDEFAEVLKSADKVWITPVFAAWTDTGRVNSADLAKACGGSAVAGTWGEMAAQVAAEAAPGDLVAVIGAGDIKEILKPLAELLGAGK